MDIPQLILTFESSPPENSPVCNMAKFTGTLVLFFLASQSQYEVLGRPQQNAPDIRVSTRQDSKNVTVVKNEVVPLDGSGSSSYDIELSDGTKFKQMERTERPAQGETGSPGVVFEGSYSYVAPDGKIISISYIADKNGFQPKGDAIPTVAPVNSSPENSRARSITPVGVPFSSGSEAAPPPQSQPSQEQPTPIPAQSQPQPEVEDVAQQQHQADLPNPSLESK